MYPPAVEKNWKDTFKLFGIKRYAQFVSNGSLSKIIHGEGNFREKGEYDMVIVDEAHNFRGETAARYDDLLLICKTPRVNEGLVKGRQKKNLLHSTIVYLSSPQKIEYYWVHDDGRAESIPFLDAMDIMKAKMDEQPEPFEEVMDYHYEQVKNAVQSYKSHVIAVVDTDSIANMKKDKSTNDVLSILRMMQRTLGADEVHNGQSIEQCMCIPICRMILRLLYCAKSLPR